MKYDVQAERNSCHVNGRMSGFPDRANSKSLTKIEPTPRPKLPPGYRARRGLNWGLLGLMYTSFYLCRYNLSYANESIAKQFGFRKSDMSDIIAGMQIAYACGQIVNGLLTDRLGGKRAMLIGAVGTIVMNGLFGAASFWGFLWLFVLIRSVDGYLQAFGSPGFIKINAAWFGQTERGTFAGIFGFMINLGRFAIAWLGPSVLAGFALFWVWKVPPLHWRWLFWIPSMVAAVAAVFLAIFVKDTPEEAGFHDVFPGETDHADTGVQASIKTVFLTITTNPVIWVIGAAYACTGAVRQAIDQWWPTYFQEVGHVSLSSKLFIVTGIAIPLVASAGSFISGIISDRLFQGRRAPVALAIYFIEVCVVLISSTARTPGAVAAAFIAIAFTANSTHSLLGTSAAMDIGGRKMAGFASGVIDSFQYFGAGFGLFLLGFLLNRGWHYYFYFMAPFGVIGGFLMWKIAHLRTLKKPAPAQAG